MFFEPYARVKVFADFGMAFLRNKNGAAVEQFLKPVPTLDFRLVCPLRDLVLEVYTIGESRHFLFSHGDRVASSQLHGRIWERLIIDLSSLLINMR